MANNLKKLSFTKENARNRAAGRLKSRRLTVTCFNVTDGVGTTYCLEYPPPKKKVRG